MTDGKTTEQLAAQLGVTLDALLTSLALRTWYDSPGRIRPTDAHKAILPRGTVVNLRREFPPATKPADLKWTVCGYRRAYDGEWIGYELRRVNRAGTIEVALLSRAEAFDLVTP